MGVTNSRYAITWVDVCKKKKKVGKKLLYQKSAASSLLLLYVKKIYWVLVIISFVRLSRNVVSIIPFSLW